MLKFSKKEKEPSRTAGVNQQGITAGKGMLYRLAGRSLAVALIPLIGGFTYAIAVSQPAEQADQVARVASAFATQQSTNIYHMQQRLQQRLASAARSPLAQSAVAGVANTDLDLLEQAMRDYFPEVVSLRILQIDDLGTAPFSSGSHGLRNHIELDLVRSTAEGMPSQPEAYQFEGAWLTSFAAKVAHPRLEDQRGVLIVTLSNELLSQELKSLHSGVGRFELQQQTAKDGSRAIIASTGTGGSSEYTQHAAIPDTPWRVAFTPSIQTLQSFAMSSTPLLVIMAISVAAAVAAAILALLSLQHSLSREADRIISASDKKTPLQLELTELVPLAKQLRRATLRSLNPRISGSRVPDPPVLPTNTPAADLRNPLFHSTGILVEEEGEEALLQLDLAQPAPTDGASSAAPGFPHHIFRAYDIRGVAATELDNDLVAAVGGAIGTLALEQNQQALVVACDGRESSERIKNTLVRALLESGRDVIDIGMVPTPLLHFATYHLECRSGVMVTGSHNPPEYNGLKIVIDRHTLAAEAIQDLRARTVDGKFSRGAGRIIKEDLREAYLEEVIGDIAVSVPLTVVLDAGNGAVGPLAPLLFEELGCDVIPLHCKVDGSFPNRPPDTSVDDNLLDLIAAVKQHGADLGIAFDGDGDRLAVVSGSGRIVRPDSLMMIYAEDVVSRNPGTDVVFDVKCSRNLAQVISHHGGRPVLCKSGHAFMREKMLETGALLGGEFSGHIFFGERWYGFDDGMYAAGRLVEILSTLGESLDQVVDQLPPAVSTPEILIPVDEAYKFSTIEAIARDAQFPTGKVNTLDGLRVDFSNGWGLVRASNTTAALTARFEADTQEGLEAIMGQFRSQIDRVDPTLELNF